MSKLGSPCWIGIPAVNVAALKTFYSTLFPTWQFRALLAADDPDGMVHFTFTHGPSEMSGGIVKVPEEAKAVPQNDGVGLCVYHYVESIDKAHVQILELGGMLVFPKTPESDHGFYAKYRDTEGNIFGIYEVKN